MKPGEVAEFLFAGAGSMPGLLIWLGDPGLALIVLVALLLAACMSAMADPEVPFRARPAAGSDESAPVTPHSGMRQALPHLRQRTRSHG
jgi:hypothetical protein